MPFDSWEVLAAEAGEFSSLVEMFNVFGTDTLKVLDRIEKAMVSRGVRNNRGTTEGERISKRTVQLRTVVHLSVVM
jgi:hypothetical protein